MFNLIQGPLLAILSAVLFGISPVLCKLVIGDMSPVLLAGLLYLGSGIGLTFVLVRQHINIIKEIGVLRPNRRKFQILGFPSILREALSM